MESLRQIGGADIAAGFDIEDLLRLALFVANDAAADRIDLERGLLRGHQRLLLDRFLHFRAALRGRELFVDRDPHPIFARGENDGRAAQVGLPIVQPVDDREMRRGVVRRENVRAADHVEHGKFIQLARLDRVGQLDRGDDALDAGLLRVFRKNDAFDLSAEGRRDGFVLELVQADV